MQTTLTSLVPRIKNQAGSPPAFAPKQKLAGSYVLRRELGKGALATVWLAFDEVLGKEVSLHFIPPEVYGDDQMMGELRQAIKRNRQLIHPNILRIYDLVEETDWAAISMDTLTGESIAALQQKRPAGLFEIADVKPWLQQLCPTLDDAHRIQLFHRDLSPENLFLENNGRLLIANFGISRCIREASWRAQPGSSETRPVHNMSPQMLDCHEALAADDIYGIGILLHELLSGQPPFTGNDVIEKIQRAVAPGMLEHRSQRKKAGGPIPPNWEKVVAACLHKQPEQRPKSLRDLAERLGLQNNGTKSPTEREASGPELRQKVEPQGKDLKVIGNDHFRNRRVVRTVTLSAAQSGERTAPATLPSTRESATESKGTPPVRASGMNEMPVGESAPSKQIPIEKVSPMSSPKLSEKSIPDHYPALNPQPSRFPVTGLAIAALLIASSVYVLFSDRISDLLETAEKQAAADSPRVEDLDSFSANSPLGKGPESVAPDNPSLPTPEVFPVASKAGAGSIFMLAAKDKTSREKEATPRPVAPASKEARPVPSTTDPNVAAKAAALEAARKAANESEKVHEDLMKRKEQAQIAVSEAKRILDEKTAAAAPTIQAAEEITTLEAKREEEMRAAELTAEEAKKLAEEKARLADEAKKAVANTVKDGKERIAARQRVEAELKQLKDLVTEKERLAVGVGKSADAALATRDKERATVQQFEQQLTIAKAAAEEAEKLAAARRKEQEEKRAKIIKEMEDAKRLFEERMKALEAALKEPGAEGIPSAKAPVDTTAPTKSEPSAPAPDKGDPEAPALAPSKPLVSAAPNSTGLESTLLAKAEPPKPMPATSRDTITSLPPIMTNSLGMRFVPVGDLQFSVWQTRVSDFEAFASATGLKSNLWRDPGYPQKPDHPVVNVTWLEAVTFCKWLTLKEQREGTLPADRIYRLPTDLEWSRAVGLPEESGKTPEARDMGVENVYPWGTQWPPPPGVGNYTGEETGSDGAIRGYNDGYQWTSPVGSFEPNNYGLFDMGGNVWQWVADAWSTDETSKVLRGASWYNGVLRLSLLSSCRVHAAQDSRTDNYGFRCVIAPETAKSSKR